jgi:hypothetical protein
MQPYFFPYAGYFRLFAASDVFVIYDCVQFPRRGWVHRNKLLAKNDTLQWLTLPLQHAAMNTRIADMVFRTQARHELDQQLPRFSVFESKTDVAKKWCNTLFDLTGTPVDYLEKTLRYTCKQLGFSVNVLRSSQLSLPDDLHGEQRILAIARELSADVYVNSPGGRDLYAPKSFEKENIELRFLKPWSGSHASIFQRVIDDSPLSIACDIRQQSQFESFESKMH